MDQPHRYLLAGARGGQGTTTVALALAVFAAGHRRTALACTRPDDACALAGAPTPAPGWSGPWPLAPRLTLSKAAAASRPDDGPPGSTGAEVVVADAGRLDDLGDDPGDDPATTFWLVVRGPCYLSLRAAAASALRPAGVVLLAEPGRSLSPADVADVLGAPVVARLPVEPAVARCLDAGLLLADLARLSAFAPLARLVQRRYRCAPPTLPEPAP